jgi:hypothetical protein
MARSRHRRLSLSSAVSDTGRPFSNPRLALKVIVILLELSGEKYLLPSIFSTAVRKIDWPMVSKYPPTLPRGPRAEVVRATGGFSHCSAEVLLRNENSLASDGIEDVRAMMLLAMYREHFIGTGADLLSEIVRGCECFSDTFFLVM